jgi:hypothetical protein
VSAFEVDNTHIDALISAAVRRDTYGTLNWHHGDLPGTMPGEALPDVTEDYRDTLKRTRREVTPENAGTWGATLLAENRRSVNHRYAEDEIEAPYIFTEIRGDLDPVAILKAIDCYEYQSCEHPGWEASESRAFCDALRRRMIRKLPGYSEAPWEVTDPKQVVRFASLPIQERRAAFGGNRPASRPARTIPRNATRQIDRLRSTLGACTVYTLDNGFKGKAVPVDGAWEALKRGGTLRDNGNGTYTVRVHSNCWYELTTD